LIEEETVREASLIEEETVRGEFDRVRDCDRLSHDTARSPLTLIGSGRVMRHLFRHLAIENSGCESNTYKQNEHMFLLRALGKTPESG
jgi:hypothetical protein